MFAGMTPAPYSRPSKITCVVVICTIPTATTALGGHPQPRSLLILLCRVVVTEASDRLLSRQSLKKAVARLTKAREASESLSSLEVCAHANLRADDPKIFTILKGLHAT